MSLFSKVKAAAATVVNGAIGCTCGPGGLTGGCHCDFLDVQSPTTNDVQQHLDRQK